MSGFGVFVTSVWVLVATLGEAFVWLFARDCGLFDLDCDWLALTGYGMLLGLVVATVVTTVVVRRWRRRPPRRAFVWFVGVVLPVVVVIVAKEIWG